MKVVIIGAGVAGLQCASVLTRIGCNVCVLEKEKEAGGSWHYNNITSFAPAHHIIPEIYERASSELSLNIIKEHAFNDKSYIFDQIQTYTRSKELDRYILFNSKVVRVERGVSGRSYYTVYYECSLSTYQVQCDFLVIATGRHSVFRKPDHESYRFVAGPVLTLDKIHKYSFNSKHITLINSDSNSIQFTSKNLIDASVYLLSNKLVDSIAIVSATRIEAPSWTTQTNFNAIINLHKSRKAFSKHHSYYDTIKSRSCMMLPSSTLKDNWSDPGLRYYHADYKKFHEFVNSGQITLCQGVFIRSYGSDHITLSNSQQIRTNALIFCNTFNINYGFLSYDLLKDLYLQKDGIHNYRYIIPPKIPNLAFIGTEVDSFTPIITSFVQSIWLVKYILGNFSKSSKSDMVKDIKKHREWKAKTFQDVLWKGSALFMFADCYHRQLLSDIRGKQVLNNTKLNIIDYSKATFDEICLKIPYTFKPDPFTHARISDKIDCTVRKTPLPPPTRTPTKSDFMAAITYSRALYEI